MIELPKYPDEPVIQTEVISRTPNMGKGTLEALIAKAKNYGFATEKLIFPDHGKHSVSQERF